MGSGAVIVPDQPCLLSMMLTRREDNDSPYEFDQYYQNGHTVTPRYNAVVGRHLLGPPYKRGALWDPVDLFDIIIPRQSKGQAKLPRLEVEVV